MANLKGSENPFPHVLLEEVATDGSDTGTPAADFRHLFLGEDGALHLKDSAAAVTDVGGAGAVAAEDVSIADAGTYYTGTDVEAALQEIGADIAGLGAGGGAVPAIVQFATNSASTTSLAVTIAAAASGQRLIVCIGSNARDVNTPTCTNVTFTEVGTGNFSTTMYVSIYVGVVAGGASGTSVTITATGANFIEADVYEVSDVLTPTAGTPANLSNTSASTQAYVALGPIAPAAGVLWAAVFGEDNGGTTMRVAGGAPFRQGKSGAGTGMSMIGYAPGGPFSVWVTAATTNADFAAVIVPVT